MSRLSFSHMTDVLSVFILARQVMFSGSPSLISRVIFSGSGGLVGDGGGSCEGRNVVLKSNYKTSQSGYPPVKTLKNIA